MITQQANAAETEQAGQSAGQADRRLPATVRQEILRAIAQIEFGSVEIVIHEGRVVQIECREKIRIGRISAVRSGNERI